MAKKINQAGFDAFKNFGESWQRAMNASTIEAYQKFADNWHKSLNEAGLEQMKAYGEMMKKFAETWDSMWPQKTKQE